MSSKYVVVISFDAVSSEDIEILKQMKNFKNLIENGALIKNVESVYPSLTYPAHTTIVTGKYPNQHGVIDNTFLDINSNKPDWYLYRKYIKCETLYDLAIEKGLTVSAILWPVTGRSKITYNMPEIHCNKFYDNQILKSLFAGSPIYQYQMNKKFGHIRNGIKQPMLDDFSLEVAKETIKTKKPNLLLLHLIDVDYQKHSYGVDSDEVKSALRRHDMRLGEIIKSLKEVGIYEETTIIALGDHSQIDVNKVIRLNSLFKDENLIRIYGNKIFNYSAISKSCDGCSYIYCKDEFSKDIVYKLLKKLQDEVNSPIKCIFKKDEISKLGADLNSDFIVEAKQGYYFEDDFTGEIVQEISQLERDESTLKACHGYLPNTKGYKTFFLACGKGIKNDVIIEQGSLINHAPTIAKLLGIEFNDIEGKVEDKILI